ncbi:amino acid permease [Bacillus albus]|uniref:Amino acid permease n=1 Tax=Bacillus albus TaxID=2026189 RepID=A0ABM7E2W6_9BACI|nr:amino acid permease [Bacillus albus]
MISRNCVIHFSYSRIRCPFFIGVTASIAGPASIVSWFIVIIISFPLAYSFASLARIYPDSVEQRPLLEILLDIILAISFGWFYFVTAAVGQTIVSLTGAFYVSQAFGFSHFETILIAVFILVIAGVSNYYGVNVSGKVALILSSLLLILLASAVFVAFPRIQWGNFTPFVPNGWFSVGNAITVIFWSFFGWEAICNWLSTLKDQKRYCQRSSY